MSIQQELTELEANFSNFNNPDEPTTKGTFKKMISGEYGKPLISNYDFFQIDSYHSNKLSPELCKLIKEKIASSDFTSNIPEQDIKEATRMSNDILDFTDLNDGSKLHNNVAKILTEELTRRSYLSESQIEKMGSSIDTYLEEFTYKNSESDEIERDLVEIIQSNIVTFRDINGRINELNESFHKNQHPTLHSNIMYLVSEKFKDRLTDNSLLPITDTSGNSLVSLDYIVNEIIEVMGVEFSDLIEGTISTENNPVNFRDSEGTNPFDESKNPSEFFMTEIIKAKYGLRKDQTIEPIYGEVKSLESFVKDRLLDLGRFESLAVNSANIESPSSEKIPNNKRHPLSDMEIELSESFTEQVSEMLTPDILTSDFMLKLDSSAKHSKANILSKILLPLANLEYGKETGILDTTQVMKQLNEATELMNTANGLLPVSDAIEELLYAKSKLGPIVYKSRLNDLIVDDIPF
jgi:hypothetical protein